MKIFRQLELAMSDWFQEGSTGQFALAAAYFIITRFGAFVVAVFLVISLILWIASLFS
jgi:preprotein translocase subunit SecG